MFDLIFFFQLKLFLVGHLFRLFKSVIVSRLQPFFVFRCRQDMLLYGVKPKTVIDPDHLKTGL